MTLTMNIERSDATLPPVHESADQRPPIETTPRENEPTDFPKQDPKPLDDRRSAIDVIEPVTQEPTSSPSDSANKKAAGVPIQHTPHGSEGPPYSTFSEPMKIFTILLASFAAIISPISASIYFPALNTLARDLHVSTTSINLTITTYMVRARSS